MPRLKAVHRRASVDCFRDAGRHLFLQREESVMSNEMVQRVAMAIYDAEREDPTRPPPDELRGWRAYEAQARAAIAAMRAPSEEMIFRGGLIGDTPWDGKKPGRVFSAMIDAALQK
jgi:hypothetical protein